MNRMISKCSIVGAVVAALVIASPAFAAPWSIPSGTATNFSYSNGGDVNGLFGDPLVSGDSFFFFASNFQASAVNGGTDNVNDTVSFDVVANPGKQFSQMMVTAFGSYNVLGPNSSVDINATLQMVENAGLLRTFGPANLVTNPPFPVTSGNNSWNGQADIDVSFVFPSPSPDIHISLSTVLDAIAGIGGSAEGNLQFQSLEIQLITIPEPASLALVALGGIALIARRRRRLA
ncbi:MAG: PEP-CTERM sorting domain-containing protein [Phycisphaerae bacterium]